MPYGLVMISIDFFIINMPYGHVIICLDCFVSVMPTRLVMICLNQEYIKNIGISSCWNYFFCL